jgi:hypothetical protein
LHKYYDPPLFPGLVAGALIVVGFAIYFVVTGEPIFKSS